MGANFKKGVMVRVQKVSEVKKVKKVQLFRVVQEVKGHSNCDFSIKRGSLEKKF